MLTNKLPGVVVSTASQYEGEYGTPKTVESIVKLEQYLIVFYDELGHKHVDVVIRVGDNFMGSPFGEEWAGKLRPLLPWIDREVSRRVLSKEKGIPPEAVPAQDAVNVTGSRIVAGTQKIVEEAKKR